MLFFLIPQIGHEQVGHVARSADGRAAFFGKQGQAVAELDSGFDLSGFRHAEALDGGKLFGARRRDAFDAAELGQEELPQRDGRALGVAGADENGDQLGGGQGLRPVGVETLARALFRRQFFHRRAVAVAHDDLSGGFRRGFELARRGGRHSVRRRRVFGVPKGAGWRGNESLEFRRRQGPSSVTAGFGIVRTWKENRHWKCRSTIT